MWEVVYWLSMVTPPIVIVVLAYFNLQDVTSNLWYLSVKFEQWFLEDWGVLFFTQEPVCTSRLILIKDPKNMKMFFKCSSVMSFLSTGRRSLGRFGIVANLTPGPKPSFFGCEFAVDAACWLPLANPTKFEGCLSVTLMVPFAWSWALVCIYPGPLYV